MGAAVVVFAAGLPVLIGVLVATRSPHRVVGLLLVAHGLSVAAVGIGSSSALAGTSRLVADQLVQGFWVLLFAWLALAVYLLPDGRFPSGRWRTWVVTCAVGTGAFVLGAVGDAASFGADHPGVAPPLPTLPQPVSAVLGGGGLVAVGLLVAGAATWVARRLGHVEDDSRTRLLWLVWGAVAMPVSLVVDWLNRLVLGNISWLADSALAVGVLSVPLAIGVAILRHRLFDIRVVLSRTVTYSVMVGGVLLLYAALLEGVRRLGGDRTVGGLVAVAVVAVTVHPVFSRLRRRDPTRSAPCVFLRSAPARFLRRPSPEPSRRSWPRSCVSRRCGSMIARPVTAATCPWRCSIGVRSSVTSSSAVRRIVASARGSSRSSRTSPATRPCSSVLIESTLT